MVTRANVVFPLVLLISLPGVSAESGRPIPRIERAGNQYRFLVDGQPFLMLGDKPTTRAPAARRILSLFGSPWLEFMATQRKCRFTGN